MSRISVYRKTFVFRTPQLNYRNLSVKLQYNMRKTLSE
jgi:hypothetical protein